MHPRPDDGVTVGLRDDDKAVTCLLREAAASDSRAGLARRRLSPALGDDGSPPIGPLLDGQRQRLIAGADVAIAPDDEAFALSPNASVLVRRRGVRCRLGHEGDPHPSLLRHCLAKTAGQRCGDE